MAKKRSNRTFKRKSDVTSIGDDSVTEFDTSAPAGKAATPRKKTAKKKPQGRRKTPQDEVIMDEAHDQPEVVRRKKAKRRVHDYDALEPGQKKRRLTKKAKKTLEEWKGAQRGKKRDAYFRSLAEEGKKEFGHSAVLAGNESNRLVIGIPFPSLALEWLTLQDVWPLSLVAVLCGRWGTCKSAFLYEIFRWFAKFNGGAILQEVETRFSPDLCSSIMGYTMDECPIILNRCTSLDDWQEKLSFFLDLQKRRMIGTQEEPGPGRTIPVCFGVDSIMAKAALEKMEKIAKAGSAGRDFPIEALLNTEYFRATAGKIDNWPFSLVLVNHLKEGIDRETQQTKKRKPGGDFVNFQESFELEMGVWKSKISTADFDGRGIRITCVKNSFGETGRDIFTRMLWWDEETGDPDEPYRQKTVWDWDWSTITTLINLPGKFKDRLKEAGFQLKVRSPKADVECMAQCRNVGMGKDDWEEFHTVGAMIREDHELVETLRTALGIKRRAMMKGDFLEQLDGLRDELV